jgi:Transposase DDE domain group 1
VVGKAEWMIPSAAESEGTTKPRQRKNKKSIMAGDLDLATLEGRANPRFVVTSMPPDRHRAMRANQLRLWLSSMAYVLVSALRRIALATTRLADATCGTIRLKLFKIGAQVRISVRRIKFSMASAFPYTDVFRAAWAALDSAAR